MEFSVYTNGEAWNGNPCICGKYCQKELGLFQEFCHKFFASGFDNVSTRACEIELFLLEWIEVMM